MARFSNRRNPRIPTQKPLRYVPVNERNSKLRHAISQDLSGEHIGVLSASVLHPSEEIEMYIPVSEKELVPAKGQVMWSQIENEMERSPYWIRAGISLEFFTPTDRKKYLKFLQQEIKRNSHATH